MSTCSASKKIPNAEGAKLPAGRTSAFLCVLCVLLFSFSAAAQDMPDGKLEQYQVAAAE